MVSQSTQNYSSLKKSTWPHLLLVGQLGQTGSNLVKLVKNLYYLVRVITICRYIHVLYLGRAPRTKETLPDFREKCRVTRHSRVFRGLTGSQRTLGFWGVTYI